MQDLQTDICIHKKYFVFYSEPHVSCFDPRQKKGLSERHFEQLGWGSDTAPQREITPTCVDPVAQETVENSGLFSYYDLQWNNI